MEARTYTLNCKGEVGDMVYFTDLDYSSSHGHNIAEVNIYGLGEKVRSSKLIENKLLSKIS